jgi:hypothetical protein
MIITYIRSSSAFGSWGYCQQSYFMDYVLGHKFPANLKADLGTVCHKVFEVLASIKKELQTNPLAKSIEDAELGKIDFDPKTWLEERELTPAEITKINSTRVSKTIYKWDCNIKDGHIRYGEKLVEEIFEKSFAHYIYKRDDWKPVDKRDALNWTWIGLEFRNGKYDPRRRSIMDTETRFDFEFTQPWAQYEFTLPDGKKIEGNLRAKGTIDLTTIIPNGLEVIDWKTGQRLNWATGKEKTYEKLCEDEQLMFYYYALRKIYPEVKNFIITIFYVRDGGPFSICFDDSHIEMMENKIKKRFEEIKNSRYPKLLDPEHKDFRCAKLCPFFKNKFNTGDSQNMCRTVHNVIRKHGMEYAVQQYSKSNFDVSHYVAPGSS